MTSAGVHSFSLRPGEPRDRARLDVLLTAEDMRGQFPPHEFTVCELGGVVVGAARVEIMDNRAWIRPIVVDDAYQGSGIGSALVEAALTNHETLFAVARGPAVPFYERLGFEPVPWDEVPGVLWHECDGCPDVRSCGPLPMRRSGAR